MGNYRQIIMSVPPQGGQPMLTPWGRIAKYQSYPRVIAKLWKASPLSTYLAIAGGFVALPMFVKLYNFCNSPALSRDGRKEERSITSPTTSSGNDLYLEGSGEIPVEGSWTKLFSVFDCDETHFSFIHRIIVRNCSTSRICSSHSKMS